MVAAGLLLLSLLPLALGRPSSESASMVVRSPQKPIPAGFGHRLQTTQPAILKFVLALKPGNTSGLIQSLLDVSDPASSKYGQHLSKAEVDQLVAPPAESVQTVTNWLKNNGIEAETYSSAGDLLRIQIPPEQANTLFNANFSTYVHEKTNTTMVRTLSYSLPADVSEHLAFVYPTDQFIPPPTRKAEVRIVERLPAKKRSGSKRADIPAQCAQAISPACLQAIYNIPATPATNPGNSLGVSGFDNEVANPDDLKDFLSKARPDITNGTFAVQSIDGGTDNGQGTTEASLDIQYTVGVATNVPVTFISVGENTNDGALDGFLDIITTLTKQDNPPLVLTTSFGFDETPFSEQAPELAETLCNAYAQLGARGTSILFASGDGGVSGSQADDSCDGSAFIPTFPATCPYLTAVGSTQGINPETAAEFSAGGFSNIFARPDYQSDAVDSYLQTLGNTNQGLFNTTGRGYPDVSTQGVQFVIETAGQLQGVDGTSASSPTFASVVALLNDQLLNAGQSPLGFLNPLLYSKGVAALNDITSGSNPGCGTQGFPAAAGWDAVTGLGTPDFQKLLSVVSGGASATQNSTATSGAAQAPAGQNSTDTAGAGQAQGGAAGGQAAKGKKGKASGKASKTAKRAF
ncbi:subtilisin-like protein [Trametes coccinea BRFM310]|uniref:tripeptidyl-peptidase II n=1 Tax=Trametes coccinea (strain BRFM310) TaxID=1353009 RepID=A0A1Y2IK56_TRAC3|nr:subtilisin-like protein [Trametes coccinea BRFM310]